MSALSLKKNKTPKEPKPKKEKKVKEKKVKEKKPKAQKAKGTKVARPKVPANKYTLILLFGLLALIAACIMLYLDLKSYQ